MKRILIGIAALAVALSAPAGAVAGRGESVDPVLMQPPLNPAFEPWECWRTGTGITCEAERTATAVGADTGLVCDGRPVYTNEVDVRTQRRYGDENGLALKTVVHAEIRGVIGLESDLSGPNLTGFATIQFIYDYPIPGDLSTRTQTYHGVDVRVTGPGVGLVLHDVGIKTYDAFDENLLFAKGPHPVAEDPESAFAALCPAFEAIGA